MDEKTMKKVLIVPTLGLNFEGITTVIYNYTNAMNRQGIQLYFMTYGDLEPIVRERFEKIGSIELVSDRKKNTAAYMKDYVHLLKSHSFDVVHVHGNSGTMAIEVILAKVCGIPKIIVHTHSTSTSHPLLNFVLRYPMIACADARIACSEAAGKWLYKNRNYTVLNNAIDISRFRFNVEIRKQCRAELGVNDEFLVGHVGHFSAAKNHFFLLDIFYAFHMQKPNSKLLLVSDGPEYDAIVEKVKQLKIQDAVIFAGRRSDVERLYQAMDVFVMPSRWEGLPLVLLEAQASGLTVIASDRITADVKCTDKFWFMSIQEAPEIWAEKLIELSGEHIDRTTDAAQQIRKCGFDIFLEAGRLRERYLE